MYTGDKYLKKLPIKDIERLASLGQESAIVAFGLRLAEGKGIAMDKLKAVQWLSKLGKVPWNFRLESLYVEIGDIYATGRGHICADNETGLLCRVPVDQQKAVEWYRKGAGHLAFIKLGVFYSLGRGVDVDQVKAMEYFLRSAEQGNLTAQIAVGDRYANGKFVNKDLGEARRWYSRAVEKGSSEAQSRLDGLPRHLDSSGKPVLEGFSGGSVYACTQVEWDSIDYVHIPSYPERRRLRGELLKEDFSDEDQKEIYRAFADACFKCGSRVDLQVDHHYPLSRKHPLSLKNATLLCAPCNQRKSAKLPEDFYTQQELERRSKIIDKLIYGDD